MTCKLAYKAGHQFFDNDGQPLANGYLEYRYALTDLPYPIFKDAGQSVPWPVQIPLDASGRLDDPIYVGEDDYKELLFREDDTQVFEQDDYPGTGPDDESIVLIDTQTYPNAGSFTWPKPSGSHFVHVEAIGGGAGGGSGRKGAVNTNRCGGGGGEGGEKADAWLLASDLGSTETVTVGDKGLGGAAVTLNSTNGNDGTAGGESKFGGWLRARGGNHGKGGTAAEGQGGASKSGNALSGEGGQASATAATPEAPPQPAKGGGGGGPGGGISVSNTLGEAANGAPGSADNPNAPPGGAKGAADGDPGASGTNIVDPLAYGGPGGGGGKGGLTNPGGSGGNGASRGGAGAGGGAGVDGISNSGKGGDGAPGFVVVKSYRLIGSGGNGGSLRETLIANRTYYVRTDGSDSNDGLADTGGGAFLTIQKAIDAAASLDLSIYDVTISVGAGTYTGANALKKLLGAGTVTILGAGPTTIVNPTGADCFFGDSVLGWTLSNMKLTTITSGSAIRGVNNATIYHSGIEFGSVPNGSYHVFADQGAIIEATGDYTITGGASAHMRATWNGIVVVVNRTVTLTGTFAFGTAFALSSRGGFMRANGNTYNGGTITGARYSVDQISQIFTNGGGANYFPGNAGGTADGATFGLYN